MKKCVLLIVAFALILLIIPVSAQEGTTVTLLHFSDYHSHAVPFYAESQADMAGIARLIAYLKPQAEDPNTLVFSGGDTMNHGSPAWSDKYECVEWAWFNGILDGMAFGNHDADYGADAFADCRAQVEYPILSANLLDANGDPIFVYDGQTYQIFEIDGLKIGIFALAGPDFAQLLRPEIMPIADVTIADNIETAQTIVQTLREDEGVNAVVYIGHSLYEDDVALAQAVPGIDLMFGTHSHRKQDFGKIEGTDTYFISPFQYITYLSKVQLTFSDGELTQASGELVQMDSSLPEDEEIAKQVSELQADLEADPDYAHLYETLGETAVELSTEGQFEEDAVLGNFVMDILRSAADAHVALSTASSFREPIPPGIVTEENLMTALPYKNTILVYDMTGEQVKALLDYSTSRAESDFFSQVSGVKFNMVDGEATNIQILNDPADAESGYSPLDLSATYKVATTNFQGLIAGGYKDIFAEAEYVETELDVHELIREQFRNNSPVTATSDNRIAAGATEDTTDTSETDSQESPPPQTEPTATPEQPGMLETPQSSTATATPVSTAETPAQLPTSGGSTSIPRGLIPVIGLLFIAVGILTKQKANVL